MTRFGVHAASIRIGDSDSTVYGENTWVTTDEPGVGWPCLVASTAPPGVRAAPPPEQVPAPGSRVLTEIAADLRVATCLGDPVAADFEGLPSAAGIVYGVNGVSHQVANRILFDTGFDVRDAQGAWYSWWLFGTYGTSIPAAKLLGSILGPAGTALQYAIDAGSWLDWERRKKRCGTTRTAMDDVRALPGQVEHVRDQLESLTDTALGVAQHRSAEITDMLKSRLDGAASALTLGKIQEFVNAESQALVDGADDLLCVDSATIASDADSIAAECNAAFTRHFSDVAKLLGSDAYVKIFGAPPDAPVVLVDPTILARAH
jgi:hypothetical protein